MYPISGDPWSLLGFHDKEIEDEFTLTARSFVGAKGLVAIVQANTSTDGRDHPYALCALSVSVVVDLFVNFEDISYTIYHHKHDTEV